MANLSVDCVLRRVNLAKADRSRSSLPWHVTEHAKRRLRERFPSVCPDVLLAALSGARRCAEDTQDRKERWRIDVGRHAIIAVAAIDARDVLAPRRTVCTVVPPYERKVIVPPDRPDLDRPVQ